ncbi:MAG: alpha-hydroxy-acid oxidizing protein [Lachnospiraceae bacterium]|nr:alpha-hydroxy-acid oxidizing protein [Lachnospiraceae bacterium]
MTASENFGTISERYAAVLENAKRTIRPICNVCKICNGVACTGYGTTNMYMGGKGANTAFQNNFRSLSKIRIKTDVIHESYTPDTSISLFGHVFSLPVFAAPIGKFLVDCKLDSPYFNNNELYAEALIRGCRAAGGMAWLGDNLQEGYFEGQIKTLKEYDGVGIPTIKPWADPDLFLKRVHAAEAVGAIAVAVDLDSIGLSYQSTNAVGVRSRSAEELRDIIKQSPMPVIVKGVLSAKTAEKAASAGVAGIVVSNHGGNVIEHSENPCDVLPDIRQAVGPDLIVFADGAVRSGEDVFKLIALGANAVLIGRPYNVSVYGGGADGAEIYTRKIKWELENIMSLANCRSLQEITKEHISTCG